MFLYSESYLNFQNIILIFPTFYVKKERSAEDFITDSIILISMKYCIFKLLSHLHLLNAFLAYYSKIRNSTVDFNNSMSVFV